uniref:Cysteine proteinase inhibitor n=1 Tax=Aegilops tauschii TaxID=37682 RepID=M8CVX4_AEGTA
MRTCTLLLIVVAVVAVVFPVATSAAGNWSPIEDINSPHIQELGEWAVAEHLKQANDGIKFSKVTGGDYREEAGVRYRLIIDALNRDGKHGREEPGVTEAESGQTCR